MTDFWKIRSTQCFDNPIQYNNLTSNPAEAIAKYDLESEFIKSKLSSNQYTKVLDLGCGNGQWFSLLEPLCQEYHCVDPFISPAPQILNHSKVSYSKIDCLDFTTSLKFDLVFISGLILYLTDDSLFNLFSNITEFIHPSSIIFMREPLGIKERFVLNNHFSKELDSYYSATYRTFSEYVSIFDNFNFSILDSGWVHPDGSLHNKRVETRLSFFILSPS